MILASITLTLNRESIIGDALRSVAEIVDLCLLIDLGITDGTERVAREIVGDKVRVVPFVETDSPRNCGLDKAAAMGADWGMTLDTDERMNFKGADIRGTLAELGSGIILVPHDSGTYSKERFFKLPLVDRFVGHCHECVPPRNAQQVAAAGISFSELEKTPEQMLAKAKDAAYWMRKQIKGEPLNPRWHYYLGDALLSLGKLEPALVEFLKCSDLRGWDEESAWACFRAATIFADTNRPYDAVEACAKGLARHSGMAELAWLAGEISLSAGWADKAIYWARIAIANGSNGGDKLLRPRTHYRHVPGTTTAPYQLLSKAYAALGMAKEKAHCDQILNDLTHKEVVHA